MAVKPLPLQRCIKMIQRSLLLSLFGVGGGVGGGGGGGGGQPRGFPRVSIVLC